MSTAEYNNLEEKVVTNPNSLGFGFINCDEQLIKVNLNWGSVAIFQEDGEVICIVGETYYTPMSAESDRREIKIPVKKGQFLHDLECKVKEIITIPKTKSFRLV